MMRIDWTFAAESDLLAIVNYIAQESIQNAVAFDIRVQERVEQLADFPESGKPGRIQGTRELITPHDRYVIVYEVHGDIVSVLRIIHGGQEWPVDFLQ
jgi:toxin ParE1/3/4